MPILFVDTGSFNNVGVTGSLTVFSASAVEFQVTSTGVKIGNVSTDIHPITGSVVVTGSVNISGSGVQAPLQVSSGATSLLFVSSSGGVGIGTNTPTATYKLDVNGTTRLNGIVFGTGVIFATTQFTGGSSLAAQTYRFTNGGGTSTPSAFFGDPGAGAAGQYTGFGFDRSNGFILSTLNTAGAAVVRASIRMSGSNNTANSEAGDLIFSTQTGGTAAAERMRLIGDSRVLYTAAYTATVTSQSYLLITGSIQQVQTLSAQIYGVNIAPRMIYTTGSQTQTALRVTPTFSGSAAFSSSQQNIIADFGATSVGTQFSVNDVTSGSIYMVNDVSGLPIIEALSDWTVNMYNYPTKVFQKTGSAIIINGTQTISGSLTFAATSSAGSFNGEVVQFGAGTLTAGRLYFLSSSGTWSLADASSTGSSTGMLGIATGTSPTANGLMVRGFAYSGSYTTATGSIVYAATSSGAMTVTSPSSSNHVVRVVGYVTTIPNTIYFNPDATWVTLA